MSYHFFNRYRFENMKIVQLFIKDKILIDLHGIIPGCAYQNASNNQKPPGILIGQI